MAVSRCSSSDRSDPLTSITMLSGEAPATAASATRTRIGRYLIEGILGAGGMAVVYLARDPVLDRAVALKVLRVDGDEAGAARLVREGQALARVSHPSVIHVYEVGREPCGLIYIAMERIEGVTLAAWLETPRRQAEILDAFAAAGRGLAAAHAAGLVHRDFKPENAMVGDDGRVCVLDFGLARSDDGGELPARAAHGALTATAIGSVIGTPAYMSPEQWRGERATAASDQFSFSVALWRAVTGEHPFDLASREALRASVLAGARRPLPRALPRRLRAALERGTATDPGARFASIEALLEALVDELGRARGSALVDAPRTARGGARVDARGVARLRPRRLALAVAAAAVALAIAGALTLGASRADDARTTLYSAPAAITSRGDVAASAVSPDGTQVALLTRDAVIVQALEPGGAQRVLARGRIAYHALSWSPDGRELAFVASSADGADRAAPPRLMLADTATGDVRPLGRDLGMVALLGGGELASVGWSSTAIDIYRVADTAAPVRHCPVPGQRTGIRSMSFDAGRDALIVQLDDSDRRSTVLRVDRRCRSVETVADRMPILSYVVRPRDGRLLMREMWGSHHLVEIGDDGSARLGQHVIQSNDYAPLAVLPDGRIAHRNPTTHWALHEVGPDGARIELARGAAESRFSIGPDGSVAQIDDLYGRGLLRIGRPRLGLARVAQLDTFDGGATTLASRAVRAVWSPDGSQLAILTQTSDGYRLSAWDAATRAMTPSHLLATPYDVELTWLDERRVAFPVLSDRTEYRWVAPATGDAGRFAPGLGRKTLSLVRAHHSRRLALVTDSERGATVWTLTEGGIPHAVAMVALGPHGGEDMHVAWSADDRSLVLYDAGSGEMWSIAAEGAAGAGTVVRLPSAAERSRELTRLSDVFALDDRMVVASVVTSADLYVSAPIAE